MSGYIEKNVGITEYLSRTPGFHGILKMRYQDFQVNEISSQGVVVHLTNLDKPLTSDKETAKTNIPSEELLKYSSVLSDKDKELLKNLEGLKEKSNDCVIIKTVGDDKAHRTLIHEAIRKLYSKLESSTANDPDSGNKVIQVKKGLGGAKRKSRGEFGTKHRYHKFVLYKENIGTMDAINLIAKKLHIRHMLPFHYAGNKDKRGVTVQEVTTTLDPERLVWLNRNLNNLKVGNFCPAERPILLGDLQGNYFSIVLRDIKDVSDSKIKNSVRLFSENGFINYFGMQRFGTSTIPTYEIGKSLLNCQWKLAIDQILTPCLRELSKEAQVLIMNWNVPGNAQRAIPYLRKRLLLEARLLEGISRFGTTQLVQAIGAIPRNTRMLYIHSYQSFVWNRVVSLRLQEFGAAPVVGDLVLVDDNPEVQIEELSADEEPATKRPRFRNQASILARVKTLSANDLPFYDVTDVVLPLPGHSVMYPSYRVGCPYQMIFEQDRVPMEALDHRVKAFRMSGTYRKMIAKPGYVKWSTVRYSDFKQPLVWSDLDKLKGIEEPQGDAEGPFRALRLHFSLPTSSYATVALREVLKNDLSSATQSRLGEFHHKEVKAHQQKVSQENVPTCDEENAPVRDDEKAPIGDEENAPICDEEKAPTCDEENAPVRDDEKAPIGDEENAPVRDDEKAPICDEEKAPTCDEENAPVRDDEKAPICDEEKAPIYEEEKAPDCDQGNPTRSDNNEIVKNSQN